MKASPLKSLLHYSIQVFGLICYDQQCQSFSEIYKKIGYKISVVKLGLYIFNN